MSRPFGRIVRYLKKIFQPIRQDHKVYPSAEENREPTSVTLQGGMRSHGTPANRSPMAHHYVHDEPWRPGEAERLGRRGFAVRIAHTIGTRRDSAGLTVALYGAWGEGKTSVLRMVQEDLAQAESVEVIPFNPWRFRDPDHLVEMFFETLASRLGNSVKLGTRSEEVGRALRSYGKLLNIVPGVQGLGDAVSTVGERIKEPTFETLRNRVESGIRAAGVRPVILIDDIDRLDGAEIRAVVRLVKLTANFENTTYLLAFDPDVVAAALATAVDGATPEDGRRYLEKIVQVPLQLPSTDQGTLLHLTLEYLSEALTLLRQVLAG